METLAPTDNDEGSVRKAAQEEMDMDGQSIQGVSRYSVNIC